MEATIIGGGIVGNDCSSGKTVTSLGLVETQAKNGWRMQLYLAMLLFVSQRSSFVHVDSSMYGYQTGRAFSLVTLGYTSSIGSKQMCPLLDVSTSSREE